MTSHEQKLMAAVCRMLPEEIIQTDDGLYLKWVNTNNSNYMEDWDEVRETEMLHVCREIELILGLEDKMEPYKKYLCELMGGTFETTIEFNTDCLTSAHWVWRAEAVCRVRGVEI